MASASKTPNLNLPQWVGTEKPERTDFNAAFDDLDTEIQGVKGSLTPAWVIIPLANGWTNEAEALQVRKLVDGTIQVTGNISKGTRTDATTIGTLPAGYRPSRSTFTTSMTGSVNLVRIYVLTTGEIKIYGATVDVTTIYIQFSIATT